ncbi:MAG: lamin tail domain-containing protein [Nannocystaceae bacterium]|nr:lamin tail domain-containing protein [Nannocystaceae bacterium]
MATLATTLACGSDDSAADGTDSGDGTGTETADGTDDGPVELDCGNGAIDEHEECDGDMLDGATCGSVHTAYSGGTLECGASCTFDASGCTVAENTPLVAINEVTSDSVAEGSLMGSNDAIELYNAGSAVADLEGWQLSDDPAFPSEKTYLFPAGTMLEPGEFLVLLSMDTEAQTGELPFGFDASGEEIVSLRAPGGAVTSAVVDGFKARVSYCRVEDGHGPWFQCEQTFGGTNIEAATACGNGAIEDQEACDTADFGELTCESMGLGFEGGSLGCTPACNIRTDDCNTNSQLVINELEASTDDIELFNAGDEEFDLSGLVLTDGRIDADYIASTDMESLTFGSGMVLGPGEYLVVPLGVGAGQHPFGLNLGGDTVVLTQLSPITILDQVTYPKDSAAISYCRLPNGPDGNWTTDCTPTIGEEN